MVRPLEALKNSEARILVYLDNAAKSVRHAEAINDKLQMDQSFIIRRLREMYEKGWLTPHKYLGRTFYNLTSEAPLKDAIDLRVYKQFKQRSRT